MISIEKLYQYYLNFPDVCTDTRKISKDCFFIALKGGNFDGNNFAAQALELGAAIVLVDNPQVCVDHRYVLVDDTLKALQDLASYHRKQLDIPVIAIVGSNGKTTSKELISSVLSQTKNILFTPGNFNNHIGLPLTLLMLKETHQMAVIEMGANHVKENAFLCEIALPDYGIVTNNGKDHLEGFGSIEGVITSNKELYDYLALHQGTAFVNVHDEQLMGMSSEMMNRITYAANFSGHEKWAEFSCYAKSLQPTIKFELDGLEIESQLSGDYNFDNIMAAVCIGLHFGLNAADIKKGIESYRPTNLRSQLIQKEKNKIFLDAYNANPSSMELSIRNFMSMEGENKLLVLGDMFEMGKYEAEEHQALADHCQSFLDVEVWLVGKAFFRTQTTFRKFETTAEVISLLQEEPIVSRFIFLKGSRGMKLESLIEYIQ
ncbi:MAG: UDP-N-acetylmuramoyl-tripeptide--D-alanyl-D-alanine ligase [Bacteroidia bacterium]